MFWITILLIIIAIATGGIPVVIGLLCVAALGVIIVGSLIAGSLTNVNEKN